MVEHGALASVDGLESLAPTRVLVVEPDAPTARKIERMLLATWSDGLVFVHVDRAGDAAQELLDKAANGVLLALSLPDLDPLEAIEQIRTAAPDVPIVVLAEDEDEDYALEVVRAGAQDCLVKSSLNPELLSRALKYAIERKRTEALLARRALHDSLTGLPNRALFLDRLSVALDRSRRTSSAVAVVFLDVDNFKQINDSLGHSAGDRVLVGLAQRLNGMLRPMDTVARFGGDEFTFLFEDLDSEREVVLIAERISEAARVPISLGETQATVRVSIGIAVVTDPSIPPENVIREADAAMYRAKELGGSRYELFDELSRKRALDRLELESELRHAIERSQLRLAYQPSVSLHDGEGVVGVEALVRWEHPARGLIRPADFIPLAEETGLVVPIGRYVLEQALTQLERWRRERPEMTVSVNLSCRQLSDFRMASMLTAVMRATGADPGALCLEVAESAFMHDLATTTRVLRELKALGVRIVIDDFGTGATSLASLRELPVDAIKIHETFVRGLGGDPREAPIVEAIVELGHALGLRVVAEGVETDAQLAQLRAIGCDGAQGLLLGRPVSENEVTSLLSRPR